MFKAIFYWLKKKGYLSAEAGTIESRTGGSNTMNAVFESGAPGQRGNTDTAWTTNGV
ncbi:MAG: hypothetical protein IPI59_14280 [Sphingobacteriales bacterium]|nr:hypothetical protein [Sphingobacteriales bacterium]MBP9141113.1 hypothetical protein [Chitinophagales bacterium]MDA0197717.1 hypothetical protein [Bacteroidota bacterium]MBK6888815.1 hypothetical protein [Sphingobacteriales bacterium]MBK7528678.1 hypothetical protein [Sphingobacteriales bacterium]